jgi:hypothetical protein
MPVRGGHTNSGMSSVGGCSDNQTGHTDRDGGKRYPNRRARDLRKAPLKKQRSSGKYYIVSLEAGEVLDTDVDIEGLARKLGLLEPWERIEAG